MSNGISRQIFLKEHCNVIVPDLLGHSNSDKPKPGSSNPYSFIEYEKDLNLIFNRYATDQNIVLGHSYGGALATALANNHQDKIQKLALITPTACAPTIQIPLLYRMPVFLMELMRPLMEKQFRQIAFDPTTNQTLVDSEMQVNKLNPMYD